MSLTFTCVTNNRNSIHVSQHVCASPEAAIRLHVGHLPSDDGDAIPGHELDWIDSIIAETSEITLQDAAGSKNTWLWVDGAMQRPPYLTYVVQTDTSDA